MKNKTLILSLSLLLFPALVLVHFVGKTHERAPSSFFDNEVLLSTSEENARIMGWLDKKTHDLADWMSHRGKVGGPPDFIDFYLPQKQIKVNPTIKDAAIAKETKNLYDTYFPPQNPSSYVGTFFESGHPWVTTKRGPYQWNSMVAAGMEYPESSKDRGEPTPLFKEAIDTLVKSGMKSFRLGPNLHLMDIGKPESWDGFVDKIEMIWMAGATPTISVAFFPSLKRWEVKNDDGSVNYKKSYLLNDRWPSDMGKLTSDLMQRLWARAKTVEEKLGRRVNVVINPINEPETLAGFNRHFWHGAFANWSSPEKLRYYIPSVINIGRANVEIRSAVEKTAAGRRVLFMHNEAMTPAYYPSHNGGGRFAVSKFMLGDPTVMDGDFEALLNEPLSSLKARLEEQTVNEVEWAIKNYVFGSWNTSSEAQEKARSEIAGMFQELKNTHQRLQKETGKSMKTDNMLHLDYYYQTEFIPNKNLDTLTAELAANHGEGLKTILQVESDEAFLQMLKNAAGNAQGDLPPEGPKGAVLPFDYHKREDIDFQDLLTKSDRVMVERLIGLRRDYSFREEKIYQDRLTRAGVLPLASQLYRSDKIFADLAYDGAKLMSVLGAKSEKELKDILVASAKAVNVTYTDDVPELLKANGFAVLHDVLGMKREFLLGFEPQHYARQIRAGIRTGFYTIFMDYVKQLKLYAVGVGESGTPFYIFAPLLHDQVMVEYASALKNGIFGTMYSFGPAVDTRGWAKAPLALHYDDDHELNPSGILRLDHEHVKFRGDEASNGKWMLQFVNPLFDTIRATPPAP